jgi:large subunit ribosomal protein L1
MAKKDKDQAAPDAAPKGPPKGPPETGEAPAAPKPKKAKKQTASEEGGPRKKRGRAMRGLSKRQKAIVTKVEYGKRYELGTAVKLLKEVTAGTKFDQTVNIVLHLGIDPKHADQMIRGSVSLPRGIGKTKRVIAFCEGDEAERAKAAGAMEVGMDDLIKKVNDGWTDFDVAIAHPRSMGKVGKLGRVLGPAGKMPTPKNGTVTDQIEQAVKDFAAGKIEFRNDAGGNVHAIVGKASFSTDDLKENIDSFIHHIQRLKPATSKGIFMKKVCISGTMSPGIELDVAQHH